MKTDDEYRKIWNDYLLQYLTQKEIDKLRIEGILKGIVKQSKQAEQKRILELIEQFETYHHLRVNGKSIKGFIKLKKDVEKK